MRASGRPKRLDKPPPTREGAEPSPAELECRTEARRYRKLFRHSAYLSQDYKDSITRLVAELRTRYGLDGKREENVTEPIHRQYALAFG